MMVYVHDTRGETPKMRFQFDLKRYFSRDLKEEMVAVRWSPYDPTALLAFSHNSVVVAIRASTQQLPVLCKFFEFHNILDASYLPFATNCIVLAQYNENRRRGGDVRGGQQRAHSGLADGGDIGRVGPLSVPGGSSGIQSVYYYALAIG